MREPDAEVEQMKSSMLCTHVTTSDTQPNFQSQGSHIFHLTSATQVSVSSLKNII